MGDGSKIEWTDATWNPVTGCDKVSAGCKNCYAEKMAERLQKMGQANYANGFKVTLQPHMLEIPLRWKRPRKIFVNSMSDLFHKDVPTEYIRQVFEVMRTAKQHTFQVLTKRSERLLDFASWELWAPNIWVGVSVENEAAKARINHLRAVFSFRKFLSVEPLIGPLNLKSWELNGIDWVIVGGESGPNHRPIEADWVREIRDVCKEKQVPFFFKQWGGSHSKANGALLDDVEHKEFPRGELDRPAGWAAWSNLEELNSLRAEFGLPPVDSLEAE